MYMVLVCVTEAMGRTGWEGVVGALTEPIVSPACSSPRRPGSHLPLKVLPALPLPLLSQGWAGPHFMATWGVSVLSVSLGAGSWELGSKELGRLSKLMGLPGSCSSHLGQIDCGRTPSVTPCPAPPEGLLADL